MGRPTKYKAEYVEAAAKYCTKAKHAKQLPTLEGFALEVDVTVKTLTNWGDRHPEFLRALERLKAVQKTTLINRGLNSTYNSVIAKLVLSCNHGMHETKNENFTGDLNVKVSMGLDADSG